MERKKILPEEGECSFLGRLGTALDNTFQQVDHLAELSRNTKLLKESSVPFIQIESELMEKNDDIFTETKAFYDKVKNHPINLDDIENRLLSLRVALTELNDNPTLINKGLQPFIPSLPVGDSSYISPVPTNRSQQSSRLSFASSAGPQSVAKTPKTPAIEKPVLNPVTPLRSIPVPNANYFTPSLRSQRSAENLLASCGPKQALPLFPVIDKEPPAPEPVPVFNQNFQNPQLNDVMARLAAWKTRE